MYQMIHFGGAVMFVAKDFLSGVFLFQNVKTETLVDILQEISPEVKKYSHKEVIYTPNQ